MTFFLKNALPTDAIKPQTGNVSSWGAQAVAAGDDFWARRDSWQRSLNYSSDLAVEMEKALGGSLRSKLKTAEELREYDNPKTRGYVAARMIGQLRGLGDAGQLAGLPGSPEEFDAEVLKRRKTDFDANRKVLEAGDSTSARIVGEMGATLAEPENIITMPLGGPAKALGKFIATEAALGVAADLPGVLREQKVAKDLGFKPENPVTALATSAVASGAFAGVIGGAVRAIDYRATRKAAEAARQPDGKPGFDHGEEIDTAEHALRGGREPAPVAGYRPDPTVAAEDDPAVQNITRLIVKIEAGSWDRVYAGSKIKPPRPLTSMTVDEVLAWQARSDAAGSASTAAGGLQIIQSTLRNAKKAMGLSGNEIFDATLQSRIMVHLMKGRGLEDWRAGRISTEGFLDRLSQEWAALPRATGPNRGRSHYDGDGLNAARVDVDKAIAYLNGEAVPDAVPTPSGRNGGGTIDMPARLDTAGAGRASFYDEVVTPAGSSFNVEHKVMDLSDLVKASGDLQPRDRGRVASDEQIAEIAANLDPRRLLPQVETSSGAPIVGPDRIIESGNGRVGALERAAELHPEKYQAYVKAIEDAGFAIPEGVTRPVLVSQRITDMTLEERIRTVRENNAAIAGRMSVTEQAGSDAGYLTQHAFDAYRPGQRLGGRANEEFLRRVFAAMPQSERGPFRDSAGSLSIDGLRRMRQAMFARAFEAEDLLKLLAETENPAVEKLLLMLEQLAPDWAAFRAAVDAGYVRPQFDITAQLMDAVRLIAKARLEDRDGQSVIAALRDALATPDMFQARDTAMGEALIDVFYRGDRARPQEAVAGILQRYMAEAGQLGRADVDDALGRVEPIDVLQAAVRSHDAREPMPEMDLGRLADADKAAAPVRIDAAQPERSADGAASPLLIRATDTELREVRAAAGDFHAPEKPKDAVSNPTEAINDIIEKRSGEAVIHRHPQFGDVVVMFGKADSDMSAGRSGFGLKHIVEDRPEGRQIANMLPEILDNGQWERLTKKDGSPGQRIAVRYDHAAGKYKAIVSLDYFGAEKTWIVTGYRRSDAQLPGIYHGPARGASSDAPDATGPVKDERPTTELQDQVARQARTSDEPPASASSRIPDANGQGEDSLPAALDQAGVDVADAIESAIAEARAAVAADPDLSIRIGEGPDAQSFSVADLLRDIDDDETLITRMTSCSLKGVPR